MEGHEGMEESGEIGRLQGLGAHDPAGPTIAAFAEAHRRAGDPDKALRLADEGLAAQPDLVAARVARALALLDLGRAEDARRDLEAVLRIVADHPVARALVESPTGAAAERESFGDFDENELDRAFVAAEPETDQMVSANDFAEAAIHAIDDEPESPWEAANDAAGSAWAAAAEERGTAWAGADDGPEPVLPAVEVSSTDDEPELEWDRSDPDPELEWDPSDGGPEPSWDPSDGGPVGELVIEAEPDEPGLAAGPDSPYATATMAHLLDEQGHREAAAGLRDSLATRAAPPEPEASPDDPTTTPGDPEDRRILSTLEGWLSNLRRRTE